jgi:hypothetical protein
MSSQGTILQRQGRHLPIWPVAALLVALVATAIGFRVAIDFRQGPVAVNQGLGTLDPTVIENWAAAVRELPRGPFHEAGRAHEVILEAPPAATMPVQRVYPEGFGDIEESSPIFDGRRRKW